jgi:hypothetical protein
VTALACSLAFLGSLAFVAFVVWMRRPLCVADRVSGLEVAVKALSDAPRIADFPASAAAVRDVTTRVETVESTVSTLALAAGLKARGSPRV